MFYCRRYSRYAKNKDYAKFNQVIINEELLKNYTETDEFGRYKWKNFIRSDTTKANKPNGFYPIYVSPDLKDITLEEVPDYLKALPISNGVERAWIVKKDNFLNKLDKGEIKADIDDKGNVNIYYKIREQQVFTTHWVDKKYNATAYGTSVLKNLMDGKVFDFPKSLYLVEDIIKMITNDGDIVLDFFSGSATTAHAVMDLNNQENVNRHFILVQLPEPCGEDSLAYKSGYDTICKIGEERIRRSGDKIVEESNNHDIDTGFRIFKLDSSNLIKWNPDADDLEDSLLSVADNIVEGRTSLDLVYEIMLKYGLELTLPVEEISKDIFSVAYGSLVVCLRDDVGSDIINEIFDLVRDSVVSRVVFKDNGFKSDADKTNIKENLRTHDVEEFITI